MIRIERGEANQPVHPVFSFQVSVCIISFNFEGDLLDPRHITFLEIQFLYLVFVTLGITYIHSHQHLGPVLALGSAGARIDLDDGAEPVFLTAEHIAEFKVFDQGQGFLVILLKVFLASFPLDIKIPEDHQFLKTCLAAFIGFGPDFFIAD